MSAGTYTSHYRTDSSSWRWELESKIIDHVSRRGVIPTSHGYVETYAQDKQGNAPAYSALRIILNGVIYERHYERAHSHLYLCRLAKRFAAEAAGWAT